MIRDGLLPRGVVRRARQDRVRPARTRLRRRVRQQVGRHTPASPAARATSAGQIPPTRAGSARPRDELRSRSMGPSAPRRSRPRQAWVRLHSQRAPMRSSPRRSSLPPTAARYRASMLCTRRAVFGATTVARELEPCDARCADGLFRARRCSGSLVGRPGIQARPASAACSGGSFIVTRTTSPSVCVSMTIPERWKILSMPEFSTST